MNFAVFRFPLPACNDSSLFAHTAHQSCHKPDRTSLYTPPIWGTLCITIVDHVLYLQNFLFAEYVTAPL